MKLLERQNQSSRAIEREAQSQGDGYATVNRNKCVCVLDKDVRVARGGD